MNRNIAVFILLILLASSFKYRTKAVEAKESPVSVTRKSIQASKSTAASEFDLFLSKMKDADQELAKGNSTLMKVLWSHDDDVTIFGSIAGIGGEGWKSVAPQLDLLAKQTTSIKGYSSEIISSRVSENLAYLLQDERLEMKNGKFVHRQATLLLRKDQDGWKIIHRHADYSPAGKQSS